MFTEHQLTCIRLTSLLATSEAFVNNIPFTKYWPGSAVHGLDS
jgi:hypothetical protein